MSVINDMLRDLDQRDAPTPKAPFGEVVAVEGIHGFQRRFGWVLALLVGGVAVWGVSTWNNKTSANSIGAAPVVGQQAALIAIAPENIEKKPETAADKPQQALAQAAPVALPMSTTPASSAQNSASVESLAAEPEPTLEKKATTSTPDSAPVVAEPISDSPASFHKRLSESPAAQADGAYQKAMVYLDSGEFAEAETELQQAITLQPQHAPAITALATLYLRQNRLGHAERLLAPAVQSMPRDAELRLLLARVQMSQGRQDSALRLLHEVEPVLQEHTDYHALLAALEQQQGHAAEAASRYSSLLAIDASQSGWWLGLALAQEQQNQQAQAAIAYRRALALNSLPREAREYAATRAAVLEKL